MNGANGMSDIEGSEPRWRSCEGSSEWQRVTSEFAKLGRGGLKAFDLGSARASRAGDRALRSGPSLYLFSARIASSDL